jgi:hypothetical protein
VAGRRGVPAGPRGVHEHGWPPGARDRHGGHPGRARSGGTGRPEGGPARVGHRAGEPGVRTELRHAVRRSVPGQDAAADGGAAGELLRDRPQQRGQLRRADIRAVPGSGHPERLPGVGPFRRPGHSRAVPPGPRRGLRLPGGSPDARQPAVSRRAQLGGVPAGHGQRPGPGHHGRHGARARLRSPRPPPGPSITLRKPPRAISTPPATTASRSSAPSPATRPTATRTSCRSGRCPATWPGPAPPRRSPGSRRTCATTATTHLASPAPRAGWRRPMRSWRSGCRRSWPRRPTGTAA